MATAELPALVPESPFAEAKAKLSELMNDVVRSHRPLVVDRNRGRERAIFVDVQDLLALLESYVFDPKVSVSEGEFVVRLPELNLVASGEDLDAALEELVEISEAYAQSYLQDVDFYQRTDRRSHFPWLMRLALTEPADRLDLLAPSPDQATSEAHVLR